MSDGLFIVIAGPNGSGKSTNSQSILSKYHLSAFDWDFEFDQEWRKFDYDPSLIDGLRETTNLKFKEFIESSFKSRQSLAFETNLHTDYPFQLSTRAKKIGYTTILIFLAVKNIKTCLQRVNLRVELGGHYVSPTEIKSRYFKGLEHLDTSPEYFENILVFDTTEDYVISPLFNIQYQKIETLYTNLPDEYKPHLPNLDTLIDQQHQ